MAILPVGIGPQEGGYQIERSLRFNSADSAYLSRTPASAGNRKVMTLSFWTKLTGSGFGCFLAANGGSGNNMTSIFWRGLGGTAKIEFEHFNGSTYALTTDAVYRDPSSWYHIVLALDTSQATDANRTKLYVNSVQQTVTGSYVPQNTDLFFNNNVEHDFGATINANAGRGGYFNGYLTEINFIDGQALDPTSFGEYNSDTGVWQPKAYTGSYGTNGFYLDFADNSSTTALGYDAAGSNDWTPNNFSVTAGAGNDSLVDTPTNYGTDTGVGGEVRGNYGTWNPLRPNAAMSYANGNLDAISSGGSGRSSFGTFGMSSGKWYFETTGGDNSVGVATVDESVYGIYTAGGVYNINGTTTSGKATYTTSDVISIAYDADANTIEFFKNGVSQGSTSFSAAAGLSVVAQFNGTFSATRTCVANFGQRPFAYTAPSGFKALCTQNLPEPTVVDGGEYFQAVPYQGNSSTQTISGVGFQPDFTWLKGRSYAGPHKLFDAVRGATKSLSSNLTDAEVTDSDALTAFTSDGFSLGADGDVNRSADGGSHISWNWKAGGTGVSNTAGSITSTVSANTTAGFSIVTYTGTGANATVGHGIGTAPTFIIVKRRNSATAWPCLVKAANGGNGQNGRLNLNETASYGDNIEFWNNTSPTSTVFSVGIHSTTNASGGTYVAYCFAPVEGYSAFGSYTGNGSSDGPFVYLGFQPKYLLVKSSSSGGAGYDWIVCDGVRNTYNTVTRGLYANLSDAEDNNNRYDFLANGFKIRNTFAELNGSGVTYIYAAFAEVPMKFALGR